MSNPFGAAGDDPFAHAEELEPYTLDSTYWSAQDQEPSGTLYVPPAHNLVSPATAEEEAFAAAHQATSSTGAVPSIGGAARGNGGGTSALSFAETAAPQYEVSGRMGGSPAVPKVETFRPTRPLSSQGGVGSNEDPEAAGILADWTSYSFLNIKRYRQYFNVDTGDVLGRVSDSVIGSYKSDFIEKTEGNADLYGPFWIATTLIFVSAVTGNYASYISYRHQHHAAASGAPSPAGAAEVDKIWYYDINKVSYSAILFYGYVGVVGLALWAVLKYFKSTISLPQIWCTYGYALSVFIPISFVCIFPYEILRWTLVAVATATSGLFIMLNLRNTVFEHAGAKALPVYLTMGGLHLGLGLVLKLYFFHYW